jgi:hypothetical protein
MSVIQLASWIVLAVFFAGVFLWQRRVRAAQALLRQEHAAQQQALERQAEAAEKRLERLTTVLSQLRVGVPDTADRAIRQAWMERFLASAAQLLCVQQLLILGLDALRTTLIP